MTVGWCSRPPALMHRNGETSPCGTVWERDPGLHRAPSSSLWKPVATCIIYPLVVSRVALTQGVNKFKSGEQSQQALFAKTPKPHSPLKPQLIMKMMPASPVIPLILASLCLGVKGLTRHTQASEQQISACSAGTVLHSTQVITFSPPLQGKDCDNLHYIAEETEAWRSYITSSKLPT